MSATFFIATGNLEGTSTPIPVGNSSVTELTTGSSAGDNGYLVTQAELSFNPTGETGYNVTFTDPGGVYEGQTGVTWAPEAAGNGVGGITNDYYAAASGGDVTFTFGAAQQFFGLLWGSLSSSNTLTFYNGSTVTGTVTYDEMVAANDLNGIQAVDQGTYYVGVNVPDGFTSVVVSSADGGFEFGNVTYAASTIADPATLLSGSGPIITPVTVTSTGDVLCFLQGTQVATPSGEVAVESLKAGDLVLTAEGNAEPVRWLGVRTVASRFADKLRSFPVCVKAGALADGVPCRDLMVSPDHALLVEGVLVHAAALLNGVSITQASAMPATFTYYHVELADHALILAENTPAETFVDNADRLGFDNWSSHPDNASVAEMELPRAKSARQVPQSISASLATRAEALFGKVAAAA